MEYSFYFFYFLNGLYTAMLLFITASGLSLIFGVLGVLNLAHGAMYMLGAYFGYQLVHWIGNFWLALAIAPVVVAIMGAVAERLILRWVYGIEVSFQLLLTFGLLLAVEDSVKLVWGEKYYSVNAPEGLRGAVDMFGLSYPVYNLFIIGAGVAVAFLLWLFLFRTNLGKKIRAAAMDRDVAVGQGINVPTVFTLVFALGSAMAGLAGVLAAPLQSLNLSMGGEIIVAAFAVVVIGGLGSIPGALIGAVAIGELSAFGIKFFPRFEMGFMYILMAIVLIFRPHGLLGRKSG
ncbi:MAG: branched-chain amino acid ABC transporter permease [Proteobacteria bacterium]|nr:branched-chain amino acid ABC transporter permease [Pseudomonadota bacterium]